MVSEYLTEIIDGKEENDVLILVLVEDGFGDPSHPCTVYSWNCLNPCFSGRWFRRDQASGTADQAAKVLILVLVEDGFGVLLFFTSTKIWTGCLNPCFSGRWFRRHLALLVHLDDLLS